VGQILSVLGSFSTFPAGMLLGFSALFSITDPIGNSVLFSQLTADHSHAERVMTARRVGLYALIILLSALWAGSYVLTFFGITLPALKVGGGLAVAATGWHLLFADTVAKEGRTADTPREPGAPEPGAPEPGAPEPTAPAADIAFFPITMPLVVGPGAISVAITLGAARPDGVFDPAYLLGVSAAAAAVSAIVCILFTYAERIGRVLGPAGSRAVKRLVALLLLAIGVQIMALGVQDMLIPFLSAALHR
jgi:multiple antibiotic resistance protein